MKYLILINILLSFNLQAIEFYRSASDGVIEKITEADFNQCSKKIYRKSGKEELSSRNKKMLLRALIKGQAINSLSSVKLYLKDNPETCTYGSESEKFMN